MGAGFALIFANIGAAYGTGKSGMGISALGVAKPELVMKSIVPVRSKPARLLAWSHCTEPGTRALNSCPCTLGWLVAALPHQLLPGT
eukprot:scaffold12630_cov71-Phaeocystis_antarctica.AAC.4